jgi:hypothetical protein
VSHGLSALWAAGQGGEGNQGSGATNAHSASLTSLGQALGVGGCFHPPSLPSPKQALGRHAAENGFDVDAEGAPV